ncbi:MAG: DNA polymerase III subunit alpha, partial [Chloroflexi bacterium]|nr:DNA polymerase III subunit alpha [Chloroflexota bacterium]
AGPPPAWDTTARIDCTVCHAATAAVLPNGVVAPYKANFGATGHGRYPVSNQCTVCHDANATHISGSLGDNMRLRMPNDSFYLRSPQEMAELFGELPEALRSTLAIAEQIDLRLEFDRARLPLFPVPEGFIAESYLEHLAWDGLRKRHGTVTPEAHERLRHELDVIAQTGFARYILIVWDIVRYAREQRIPFGPRGSAAGSLVCYALGISDIDPLANRLVFERFLNVERQEMPDIDLDFADDRRGEMIAYVTQRYGRDHVAQIITFGTLGARAAIRDVGRAMSLPYTLVDRVAKLIPSLPVGITIERAMAERPEIREMYGADEVVQRLIDTARRLEGISRHASTHAAGVVISAEPLAEHVPLQKTPKSDDVVTQYHMGALAKLGLLKMDFLGLGNLTILGRAIANIRQTRGLEIDLQRIPLDDEKTFAVLGEGETTAVFQLEGAAMRRYVRELKPTSVGDLSAMVALYRPGPMAHIPRFIRAKHGLEAIAYPHAALESILRDTYGVIVYQEQVLQIVQAIAGYSLGQADILRKAMGKKIKEVMAKERDKFVAGAATHQGLSAEEASRIFDIIEPFAGYAFNRAHASCYGLLAYQTAYLKANYAVEYMTAVLSTAMGNSDKVAVAIAECRRLGIPILPPRMNAGDVGFTIEATPQGQAIRFGLAAIKNVGEGAVEALIAERKANGPYQSLDDFARRADLRALNRRVLESLVKAGVLDDFGSRAQLLPALDAIVGAAQQAQRAAEVGQSSLFDLLPTSATVTSIPLPDLPEVAPKERLAWEKELLGVYVSEHPVQRFARALDEVATAYSDQLDEEMAGQRVTVGGMLLSVRELMTKKREAMVTAQLEDPHGVIELVAFPRTYERTRELWQDDALVVVDGKVDTRGDRVQVICEEIRPFEGEESPADAAAVAAPAAANGRNGHAAVRANGGGNGPASSAAANGAPKNGGVPQSVQPPSSVGTTPASPRPAAAGRARRPHHPRRVRLTLRRSADEAADIERVRQLAALLHRHPGDDPVELCLAPNGNELVELELDVRVRYGPQLERELAALLGAGAVETVAE